MSFHRETKAHIDLGAIERNTKRLIKKYAGYKYYTAVVKADCYGYRGNEVVRAMINGGANSLAASLLEEGLELRAAFKEIPILLFTPLGEEGLCECALNNLWVTVATVSQAEKASKVKGLGVLVRVNGGSDILGGPVEKQEFLKLWKILSEGECVINGVYLHSYNAEDEAQTNAEYKMFEYLTEGIDLSQLEMVSISNSLTLPRHNKKEYANSCRLGNIIYSIESDDEELESTFSLVSQVLSIATLKKGQSIAYSNAFTAIKDDTYVAVVPIGFGDGFSKTNIGRDVFINGKRQKIVAVTMDITLVEVEDSVTEGMEVVLIKDNKHLDEIAEHIHGATEEAICALNKRVERVYKNN